MLTLKSSQGIKARKPLLITYLRTHNELSESKSETIYLGAPSRTHLVQTQSRQNVQSPFPALVTHSAPKSFQLSSEPRGCRLQEALEVHGQEACRESLATISRGYASQQSHSEPR